MDQDGDGVADTDDLCPFDCESSVLPCGPQKLNCSDNGGGCVTDDGQADSDCNGIADSLEGGGGMQGGNTCEIEGDLDSDCDGIIDESESANCVYDSSPDCI